MSIQFSAVSPNYGHANAGGPRFSGLFDQPSFYREGVDEVLNTRYRQNESFWKAASQSEFSGYELLERLAEADNRSPIGFFGRLLRRFMCCRGVTLEQVAANARISRDQASLNAIEDGLDDLAHMGLAVKVREGRNPEYRITRYGLNCLRAREQQLNGVLPTEQDFADIQSNSREQIPA